MKKIDRRLLYVGIKSGAKAVNLEWYLSENICIPYVNLDKLISTTYRTIMKELGNNE